MENLKKHRVFIALGSNLGDRSKNLRLARESIGLILSDMISSPIYETPPWGYLQQPAFLNQVVDGHTRLLPNDLLKKLKDIEIKLGRTKTFRFGPRIIDLDIIIFNNLTIETQELTIPHPRISERAFVLVPLNDLAPEFIHPILEISVNEMLAEVDQAEVNRIKRIFD